MASVCRRPAELASQCGAACSSQVPREALLSASRSGFSASVRRWILSICVSLQPDRTTTPLAESSSRLSSCPRRHTTPSSPSAWVTASRGARAVVARVTSPRCHRDRSETGLLASRTCCRGTREARRRDLDSRPMDADGRVPSRFTALRMLVEGALSIETLRNVAGLGRRSSQRRYCAACAAAGVRRPRPGSASSRPSCSERANMRLQISIISVRVSASERDAIAISGLRPPQDVSRGTRSGR
jgi:hypothetical protein